LLPTPEGGSFRAEELVSTSKEYQQQTLKSKINWRRRATKSAGLSDPEARQLYVRDRYRQWHRIVTIALDCETNGEYADTPLSLAVDAAKELKASVTRVWRARGVWHAELRVPCEKEENSF
jgi:hypothetical protein